MGSRPSYQAPRTPAKLRSTSSSPRCHALLTSASEVTSSLTRTETCEETRSGKDLVCTMGGRSEQSRSSSEHLMLQSHEMHGAPAGTTSRDGFELLCSIDEK